MMSISANAKGWKNDASYSTRNHKHANKAKIAKEAGLDNTQLNAYASRDAQMDDYKKQVVSIEAKNNNVNAVTFTGQVNYKQQFVGKKSTINDVSSPVASNKYSWEEHSKHCFECSF